MKSPETDKSIPEASSEVRNDRMKELFFRMATTSAILQELYKENDTEKLDDTIEELVDELVMDDPEWTENIRDLKMARDAHDSLAETAIVARQKELMAMYRVIIVNEAGLPDEARFTEIEQARNTVAKTLQEQSEPISDTTSALLALGILEKHDDQLTFRFPDELMPPSVQEKWSTYLASVCKHARVVKENSSPENKFREVEADRARKYAHDSVTTDVNAILDFSKIDPNWSFKETRHLLGQIRDSIFKTEDDAFTPEAQQLLAEHSSGVHASAILSARFSHHTHS